MRFFLRHGQRVGRLRYERLVAYPEKVYGAAIGSSYAGQSLTLSKQFRRENSLADLRRPPSGVQPANSPRRQHLAARMR